MSSKIEIVEAFGRVKAVPGKHGPGDLRVSAAVSGDSLEIMLTAAELVAYAGWCILAQQKAFKGMVHTGRLSIAHALAEVSTMETAREVRLLAENVHSAWERRRGW